MVNKSVLPWVDNLAAQMAAQMVGQKVRHLAHLTAAYWAVTKAVQTVDKLGEHSVEMMVDLTVNYSVLQSAGHWVA